jgi:hypothetical protein
MCSEDGPGITLIFCPRHQVIFVGRFLVQFGASKSCIPPAFLELIVRRFLLSIGRS